MAELLKEPLLRREEEAEQAILICDDDDVDFSAIDASYRDATTAAEEEDYSNTQDELDDMSFSRSGRIRLGSGGTTIVRKGTSGTRRRRHKGKKRQVMAALPALEASEVEPESLPVLEEGDGQTGSPARTKKLSTVDVYNRIKHDFASHAAEFMIGYTDRFLGTMEIPFEDFIRIVDDVAEGIPMHRIVHFRHTPSGMMFTRATKYTEIHSWVKT